MWASNRAGSVIRAKLSASGTQCSSVAVTETRQRRPTKSSTILLLRSAGKSYRSGSRAFHACTLQAKVSKLTGWIFVILDEVLPD